MYAKTIEISILFLTLPAKIDNIKAGLLVKISNPDKIFFTLIYSTFLVTEKVLPLLTVFPQATPQ